MGVLIANNVVDEAIRNGRELIMFKVNFKKAYDSIDWEYLMSTMEGMGFPVKWTKWIYECLVTTLVSMLLNGSHTKEFHLGCGLRYGSFITSLVPYSCRRTEYVYSNDSYERVFRSAGGWPVSTNIPPIIC